MSPPSPSFDLSAVLPKPDERSFVEKYAPRLADPFEPPTPPARRLKPDLLHTYLGKDLRPLIEDAASRPTHYRAEQLAVLERLRRGESVAESARSDLLLQYMRRTDAQSAERDARKKLTQKIVTPDSDPPPFENQELFRGAIRLI